MPTLRQLEYLDALSQTRHYRRAAEKAGVSQPTLSAQLSALEEKLGVKLVERSRSAVLLTPVGEQILAIGRRMLRDAEEIRALSASCRGDFGRVVRLGLPPTIGPYLMPRVLPALHAAHPGLKIHVCERPPSLLADALADGRHDLILTPLPLRGAEFECASVFREPLFVVVDAEHPFAGKGVVERADLQGEPVLALERGHQLQEQVEALCVEFGARQLFDFEGTSLETLLEMTALGMGLSFLPGLFVETVVRARPGVAALTLKGRSLHRTIGLAWRKSAAQERQFRLLLSFIRAAIARDFPSFPLSGAASA